MSPVLGLTDTVVPSLPRIGKLRKGAKADGGIGKELEWFRFVGDEAVTAAFAGAYGKEPGFIAPVFLPYRTPEENFDVWKEKWGASGLVHRCNGQMTTIVRKGNTYSRTPEKCPYAGRVYKSDAEKKADSPCVLTGRLSVILPGLWKVGHVGYVTVGTGSVNDVVQILALLKTIYETRQDLRGIAFQLRRVQSKISAPKPNSDERMRVNKWLVQLEVAPDWARLQLQMAERAAKMIEAPRVIEATGEIVEDVTDGEWLETGDDTAPDFGEEEVTDGAPMAAEDKLPPAQGGPGWPAVPAMKAKFEAVCAKNGVVVNKERNDLKAIFGPAKIGTYALSTVIQTIEDWAASQAN